MPIPTKTILLSGFILLVPLNLTEETEYWDEEDNDLDADFPPESPSPSDESEDIQFDVEQRVITWWVVVFTCTLQTLHSLPSRAAQWLLQFLYCLLTILGRYSPKIGDIA